MATRVDDPKVTGLRRNLPARLVFAILLLWPLTRPDELVRHIHDHFTGNVYKVAVTGEWHFVLLNIILFVAFLIPLSYRRKADWGEYGLVTAFFVSLFIEMYGIPLTLLLAVQLFQANQLEHATMVVEMTPVGVNIGMSHAMAHGAFLMVVGAILIIVGWVTLYTNGRDGRLVTGGIYRYSRNPQYLGFILVLFGWILGWPTTLTVTLAPILIYRYIRVCRTEEEELMEIEGYPEYREQVPLLI
jgi:protein-S-isoprenylcysteine O-methyltransferase Ste14